MGVGIFHISIAFVFLIILFLELFSLRFYRSVGSTNVLGVSLNGTEVSGTSLKNAYRGRGKILMQLQGERVSRFSTRSQGNGPWNLGLLLQPPSRNALWNQKYMSGLINLSTVVRLHVTKFKCAKTKWGQTYGPEEMAGWPDGLPSTWWITQGQHLRQSH